MDTFHSKLDEKKEYLFICRNIMPVDFRLPLKTANFRQDSENKIFGDLEEENNNGETEI